MDMMPVKPERKAQLEDYAQEAVIGIREGYEDMKAGRMRDANQIFEELRAKHGFPG
jgi:hypothetical protein